MPTPAKSSNVVAVLAVALAILMGALGSGGCPVESVALISEARAIVLARGELAKRNPSIQATDETHAITGLVVCAGTSGTGGTAGDASASDCETVSFTLDGWDPARHIGFEYVADNDPDFGHGTRWSDFRDIEHLQAAVDAALTGSGDVVLTIHQWAHETEGLAEDQFISHLDQRLDELGL